MSRDRTDCCADWPKPCSYHEGWLDAESEMQDEMDELELIVAELTDRLHEAIEALRERPTINVDTGGRL